LASLSEGGSATRNQWPLQELEALVQRRPQDPVARIRLGELYQAAGANEKAAASYEAALNINPIWSNQRCNRSALCRSLHRLDAALAWPRPLAASRRMIRRRRAFRQDRLSDGLF